MRLRFMSNHVGLRAKIAANTVAQLAGRGVGSGITFLMTILLARYFGAGSYGEFIKITTFVAFFYLFADFGMNAITVKDLGDKSTRARHDEPLQILFTTRIALSIILIWIAAGLTIFLPYSETTGEGFSRLTKLGIIILAPTILFQAVVRSTNAWFQHKLRYDKATIALITGSLAGLILITAFVYINITSILAPIFAILFAYFVTAVIAFILFKKQSKIKSLISYSPAKISALLKKSLPLGITLILNIAFFRLDTFFLAIYRPSTEVGLYGLAYKFFEFPLVIPTFFMNSVYPTLAGLGIQKSRQPDGQTGFGIKKYNNIIKGSAIILGVSSLLLSILFWVSAPYISLISADFSGSIALFRILSLWLPLFFLSSLFMWILIAKNKRWKLAKIYSAGLILNAVLNFTLIPSFGATAAAYTTGATELLILILLVLELRKENKISKIESRG